MKNITSYLAGDGLEPSSPGHDSRELPVTLPCYNKEYRFRPNIRKMLYSPLEPFQIMPIPVLNLIGITNSSFFLILNGLVFIGFIYITTKNLQLNGSFWQTTLEQIYQFIYQLVQENIGTKDTQYFAFIFSLFTLLAVNNVLGIVPYTFTATSHLVITFTLALSFFICVLIKAFIQHGLHFFEFFLPSSAPLAMAPFTVFVELLSFLSRPFSLSIRLFANMMSGHTLLHILSGFAWIMLSLGGALALASIFPIAIIVAIVGLEIGIALLQAYVFTILTCIYLHDAIYMH